MPEVSTPAPPLKAVDSLVVEVITDDVSDAYVSKTLFAVSDVVDGARSRDRNAIG